MKSRTFREIQVSSSQLALIFLLILSVAVVIFLLGVSVGKKYQSRETSAQETIITEPKLATPTSTTTTEAAKIEEKPLEKLVAAPEEKKTTTQETKTTSSPGTTAETKPQFQESSLPAKKPLEAKPVSSPVGGYFIQVGAFSKKEGTNALVQELKKFGYQPLVLNPFPADRKPLYRVRIGPFGTRQEAEEVCARLRNSTQAASKAFVVHD